MFVSLGKILSLNCLVDQSEIWELLGISSMSAAQWYEYAVGICKVADCVLDSGINVKRFDQYWKSAIKMHAFIFYFLFFIYDMSCFIL